METAVRTSSDTSNSLLMLRKKASTLVNQSEDEALLADIVAMLNGVRRPCTYNKDEFTDVLREADEDFESGRFVSHEELFAKYGL
ncbi:MAG: hypothetical protein II670_05545 [Alphaproteobacteria bacterium]|nr:hypothetical protein [Alphaproteobacteria bacterium]